MRKVTNGAIRLIREAIENASKLPWVASKHPSKGYAFWPEEFEKNSLIGKPGSVESFRNEDIKLIETLVEWIQPLLEEMARLHDRIIEWKESQKAAAEAGTMWRRLHEKTRKKLKAVTNKGDEAVRLLTEQIGEKSDELVEAKLRAGTAEDDCRQAKEKLAEVMAEVKRQKEIVSGQQADYGKLHQESLATEKRLQGEKRKLQEKFRASTSNKPRIKTEEAGETNTRLEKALKEYANVNNWNPDMVTWNKTWDGPSLALTALKKVKK